MSDFDKVLSEWLDKQNINIRKLTKTQLTRLCTEAWQAGYKYGHNEGYGDGWEDAKNAYY